jgi:uncharacterized repeat protein (TIGR03803 family)
MHAGFEMPDGPGPHGTAPISLPLTRIKKAPDMKLQSHLRMVVIAGFAVIALGGIATPAMQAQTFSVIHNFTGGADGANPYTGLTRDAAGNLYGTTLYGGASYGTIFKLQQSGADWILTQLYSFTGGTDGAYPYSRVAIARDGTLYGTTSYGGASGSGVVYRLRPSAAATRSTLTPWNETVLYSFTGGSDGSGPQGDLTFDRSGNIYGTTQGGGSAGGGVIYELAYSGRTWTETVLYSAQGNGDGITPTGGVVFDASGNLYGVFEYGGPFGSGLIYELSPTARGWNEQTIYGSTLAEGWNPIGGLIIDSSGNLYGTNPGFVGGEVFELTPVNGWTYNALYDWCCSGPGPEDKLVMDAAGSLYGTTVSGGAYGVGSAFKLTPSPAGWTYTSLHDFTDNEGQPWGLTLDSNGNIFGTTYGGPGFWGVVFEITP